MSQLGLLISKPKYIWISIYILINIIAYFEIMDRGFLIGEAASISLHDATPIFFICLLVVMTYGFILSQLFNSFYKIPIISIPSALTSESSGKYIGLILFSLQLGFITFVLIEGVFIAGSTQRSSSLWSQFFVFFSCDTLFLLYYGYYRNNRLYIPNLILMILSSLIRGWIGIFMTLLILESIRLSRRKEILKIKFLAAVSLVFFSIPFLLIIKNAIRASAVGSTFDYAEFFLSLSTNLEIDNLSNLISSISTILIERIQILSQYIVIFQNRDLLFEQYQSNVILPFWLDGIHGVAYYRFIEASIPDNLGVHLAKMLDPTSLNVNWNSNPGLFAWIIISPVISITYGLYITCILYLTILFSKSIKHHSPEITDVIWLSWLVYLIPGWTGSLFLFLHSVIVFYCIHIIFRIFFNSYISRAKNK